MLVLGGMYCEELGLNSLDDSQAPSLVAKNTAIADVPEWRVNDQWVYAGSFDPQGLIAQGGVNANVGTITGDSTNTVTEILTMDIENQTTLVYKVRATANFDKNGVSLDGYSGDLRIDYDATEYWRASDLALIQRNLGLDVEFTALGFVNIDVADVTIATSYAPPNEGYDFPMIQGERWISNSTTDVSWSGSSDYISPFPEDTSTQSTDYYEITNYGNPVNPQGQGISYGGCGDSFEITSYDSNGLVDGYNWYCPSARSYAWLHTEDSIGLTIDFRLKSYSPTASSGVNPNSNPGQRNSNINVDLKNDITALNATQEAWVNVTDSSGSPVSGEIVELRHEIEGVSLSATTASNGSAWFEFSAGDALDPSPTTYDWSSHGIIAWHASSNTLGATTMTLDDNLVGLDLVAMTDRVSIERNRSGDLRPLNDISGYNVLPGDNLTFELPVMNRGVIVSTPTTVEVQQPDGQTNSFSVPSLSTYQEFRVGFTWTVPSDSMIGNVAITYEVDPSLTDNTLDADPNNNLGEIFVFVGTLPEVVINEFEPILSMENFEFNANQSFDLDGGNVTCSFNYQYEVNEEIKWDTINSPNCNTTLSWIDDGVFEIIVTVIDEEQDTATTSVNVTVLNRPATVIISSQLTQTPALSMVTMEVFANDTDSEDDWPGLVDIYWPDANCLEGYFTRTCTTTSNVEGLKTFTAVGTDDDGEFTYADWDVEFTNAVPHDVNVTIWNEDGQDMEPNSQGTFQVNEDDIFWLRADAIDSQDDLASLEWRWRPDDQNTSWFERTEGDSTAIEVAWTRSGRNIVRLEVVDNDGASSGFIETWVDVENVPPHVDDLPTALPVAESQTVQITGSYYDTASDNDTLIACWDVDTGVNQDGVGHAADDCDAFGETLVWSWDQSGTRQVVFHVVDNDGARTSRTTNITVVNQPPRPTVTTCESTSAGKTCELTVSRILDSTDDLPYLSYTWDIDASIDSNGDGDPTNDPDLVGRTVNQTWDRTGSYKVTVRVLDEDVFQPGYGTAIVEVTASQGGLIGDVVASVIGEDANIMTQILAFVLVGLLLMVTYRSLNGRSDEEKEIAPWDEKLAQVEMERNLPQMVDLQNPISENTSTTQGTPPGWTDEQWNYHRNNSPVQNLQNEMEKSADDLDI